MFRGKKLAIYYLGLLGFLLALAFAGGYLMTKNRGQPEVPITAEEEEADTDGEGVTYYSATENILPLGRDTDSRNFGMKKQIKGVIEEWQADKLLLKVGKERLEIYYAPAVSLYCLPEVSVDKNGNRANNAEIFIDFSRVMDDATPLSLTELMSKAPEGSIMTVIATYDGRQRLIGDWFAGYGCTI